MIRVHKPAEPPAHLRSEQVERAFAEMIATGQYLDKHHSQYKAAEVRAALRACYHNKCAYCEKDLRDHDQPIDHYRPKARRRQEKGDPLVAADIGYFWLAFSWDNLQLVCNQCNRSKSTYFKIIGIAASYQGEALAELHLISTTYDQQENPCSSIQPSSQIPKRCYSFIPMAASQLPTLAWPTPWRSPRLVSGSSWWMRAGKCLTNTEIGYTRLSTSAWQG